MKTILAMILAVSGVSTAFCDSGLQGGGASDLLGSKTAGLAQAAPAGTTGVSFSTRCTDSTGRSYQSGEPGYEGCLGQAQAQAGRVGPGPRQPMPGATAGASMSLQFK